MRVVIRTSQRTRGAFNHRIEYLAEVRNAALVPLHELRDQEGEYFDTIVFMNDVLPCVDDVLELIWQSRRQNAGLTCAADYMFHDEIVSSFLPSIFNYLLIINRDHQCSTTIGLPAILMVQLSKMLLSKRFFIIINHQTAFNDIFLFRSNLAGTESRFSILHQFTPLLTYDFVWHEFQRANVLRASVV